MLQHIKSSIKYVLNAEYRKQVNADKKRKRLSAFYHKYQDLDDAEYLKKLFKLRMGQKLDLENPKTFNEKLQWLKIYNRKPIYTTMADKYAVKQYVTDLIGGEYVIPLLGVWNKFDEIDFDALPDQFVLKTTHNSGGFIVCKDKSTLDKARARKKIETWLRNVNFSSKREWPYKDISRRIIAEQFMTDYVNETLVVYKVFNFNGVPKIIQTIQGDKTQQESIDYFDTDWNLLDLRQNFPNSEAHMKRPVCLEEILNLSAKCSEGFPFLRTDWYEIDGKVYFSEFTFFSDSGLEPFHPSKWDLELGEWMDLSLVSKSDG